MNMTHSCHINCVIIRRNVLDGGSHDNREHFQPLS
ncbi:hypothetical protein CLOBOL_02317 [Enterocloster bolteae ATCC BAA-613]|uniref:Uncharacterized protein n=1 Tax=Enterocloster bolteae (strain ATCC BAA-613 / DSM 15670 / CCUG 46953 / JCM 12243 / WAL 16351) TaxID=411902 RepID=A8RNY7_ENTBW|nr:hypothetical protein CLOBOL_02317 [Enterocloster bolteae ATCC BAA-613]